MGLPRSPQLLKALQAAGIALDGGLKTVIDPDALPPASPSRRPQARYTKPGDDGMTGLERLWSAELARRKLAGEIHDFQLHSMKLMISGPVPKSDDADGLKGSWYCPDFVVYEIDGTVSFHETKGYLDERHSNWLKFKAAASRYPFAFYLIQRTKGQWSVTRYT